MAKFSAYMRGEGTKGLTGDPAGFGNISVSTISISSNSTALVIIESVTTSPDTAKDFNFYFKIPRGVEAGIDTTHTGTVTYSNTANPSVSITASGPDTAKKFNFKFTLPTGINTTGHTAVIHSLSSNDEPFVSVTTSSDTARKKLYFDFGIPAGVAAGFGTPNASVTTLPSNLNPTVSITSRGPDTAKIFDFNFGIPASDSSYKEISFSTSSSGTGFTWSGNVLKINRTIEGKYTNIIPINIYKKINNEYKAVAADFKITNSYIEYNADAKFEGYIHCMSIN